ncbi:MAG: DUF4381 domain-containing protein [Alphaproteobacteria bacterium]|nr:DUF4381 domain-containing protein [Alphaproteobacteria bacterium]
MVDLSGLRDIHIPKEPPWWPPALGWWLVLGGIIIATLIGVFFFFRWYNHPKQFALRELKKMHLEIPNIVLLARSVSLLLKRIVLIQYPRSKVATLTDEKWVDFLIKKTGNAFSASQLDLLSQATYMPEKNLPAEDSADLYRAARTAVIKLFEGKQNGNKSTKSS